VSATRERSGRLADAWSRASGVAPVASGLRRGAVASWASGRRHPRAALATALAALLLVLGCFWLWFKDSPLVSVNRVQVTGLSGPDVPRIRQALAAAAVTMTTLDVDMARLRAAAGPYPDVRSLTVNTEFPHGMVIHVVEQVPVAQLSVNGNPMAVSRDGSLLKGTPGTARLPVLNVTNLPSGTRFTGAGALATLTVLSAAPYRFLTHIQSAQDISRNGVVVQLRRGPQIRFGDTTQLHDKWAAALAVLGAPSAQGAQYIDVTNPGRPAAGAATPSGSSGGSSSTTGSSAATSGSTGSASGTAGSTSGPAASTSTATGSTGSTAGGAASTAGSSPATTGSAGGG
jgi:cell division septal protein FtsQ